MNLLIKQYGGFKISKLANAALVVGIIAFIGYGAALNADHIPWGLITGDLFKDNGDNNGALDDIQPENVTVIPKKSTSSTGVNQQSTKSEEVQTKTGKNNENLNPSSNLKGSDSKNSDLKSSGSSNGASPGNNSNKGKVSDSEAKSIADKYIEEPGASSGSPETVNISGKDTYVVPVEETGENVGGAGGAP